MTVLYGQGTKMKIAVITAYPNHTGYNYAIKKQVLEHIHGEHDVVDVDLYQEQFNPVLQFDAEHRRRDLDKDPYTAKYRDIIQEADFLIFIYPIWWSSMPAILKGFIDRVFVQGYAYRYNGVLPVALLKNKKAWIITTNDTPLLYAKFFQQDYGSILKKQILKMCGIKTVKHSQLYFVRNSTAKKRERFLEKVGRTASDLFG
ncbi:Putative NADPH-quinone reductase (modulator of drug activity B) (MdaB) [Fructobacillus fructosus]|nr:NADPH-quinone reductase (modulator of drug activity B) [Fructobacillus fructosus KCTC 3544]CAK1246166.1 Putative NADPH-quinone reductase (modulator of drug activity B) (MdaB) [Fructobacillus fructosus]